MSVVEQRYRAVLAVQAGDRVVEVAAKLGVSRQSVHTWLARYAEGGLVGLEDRSHRPAVCPHQASPQVEAAVCELRREHPRWGARRIAFELGRNGCPGPVPSRMTVYRILDRHGLHRVHAHKTVTIEVTDTDLFVHCDDGIRTIRRTTDHPVTQIKAHRPRKTESATSSATR